MGGLYPTMDGGSMMMIIDNRESKIEASCREGQDQFRVGLSCQFFDQKLRVGLV